MSEFPWSKRKDSRAAVTCATSTNRVAIPKGMKRLRTPSPSPVVTRESPPRSKAPIRGTRPVPAWQGVWASDDAEEVSASGEEAQGLVQVKEEVVERPLLQPELSRRRLPEREAQCLVQVKEEVVERSVRRPERSRRRQREKDAQCLVQVKEEAAERSLLRPDLSRRRLLEKPSCHPKFLDAPAPAAQSKAAPAAQPKALMDAPQPQESVSSILDGLRGPELEILEQVSTWKLGKVIDFQRNVGRLMKAMDDGR